MAQPLFQIPSELWNHVFGYLSVSDKFNVRTSCKYFRRLIDHVSLWRDWTVVLAFQYGSYNSRFWATLRRRRVSSAVVKSSKAKDWEQLSRSLPALTTLVMDHSSQMSLDCIKRFPALSRLAIRSSYTPLLLDASTVSAPHQLTYFSMCDVTFPSAAVDSIASAVSQFTSLTSLVCHHIGFFEETFLIIQCILRRLPWLRHLSLSVVHNSRTGSNTEPSNGQGASDLLSLELIDCMDHSLPEDAMKLMPGLERLAVFYRHSHQELPDRRPSPVCHLKTWLSDLPQLSNLVIVKGPPVKHYVASIPATVTSLTLRVPGLSSNDLTALAVQVPDLLRLHVDPWPSHLGAQTDRIPHLFPKLRHLTLRHGHVPETSFLKLHQLRNLKYLEILDNEPHLSELTGKLQALTHHRLKVTTSPHCNVLNCSCVC